MPTASNYLVGSPEKEIFKFAPLTRQASRWKQDFEELELLVSIATHHATVR
jgi:hypothetical protein